MLGDAITSNNHKFGWFCSKILPGRSKFHDLIYILIQLVWLEKTLAKLVTFIINVQYPGHLLEYSELVPRVINWAITFNTVLSGRNLKTVKQSRDKVKLLRKTPSQMDVAPWCYILYPPKNVSYLFWKHPTISDLPLEIQMPQFFWKGNFRLYETLLARKKLIFLWKYLNFDTLGDKIMNKMLSSKLCVLKDLLSSRTCVLKVA